MIDAMGREFDVAYEREIFERVKAHLLKQGRKAVENGRCRYRSPDGLDSCAIGCLISDEVYEKTKDAIEGAGVDNSCVYEALRASGIDTSKLEPDFLHDLQSVHDRKPVSQWRDALDDFASLYGLYEGESK